jgi:hypothetical protein
MRVSGSAVRIALFAAVLTVSCFAATDHPDGSAQFLASQLKFKKGLAIDIGCGNASLLSALAKVTELSLHGIEADETLVAQARTTIDAAGVYGVRASVGAAPLDALPLPDHCANLVFFGDECSNGLRGRKLAEVYRILSPNGVALIGRGANSKSTLNRTELEGWLKDAQIKTYEILTENGLWARITKSNQPGWDEWTHRAHDAANTFATNDTSISGQSFKPKWYNKAIVGLSSATVAVSNGRIIFSGMGYASAPQTTPFIQVLDAFTGTELWSKAGIAQLPIDRPMGMYSNRENSQDMVVQGDTLYLLASKFCQVIDLKTGNIERALPIPAAAKPTEKDVWTYVSSDGSHLFGAYGNSPKAYVDWNLIAGSHLVSLPLI